MFLNSSTSVKSSLTYINQDLIGSARNLIFKNLSLNRKFLDESEFLSENLENCYQAILESKKCSDENTRARVILLLHISKSNLSHGTISHVYFNQLLLSKSQNPYIQQLQS